MTYQRRIVLFLTSFLVLIIITLAGFIYFETSSILNENSQASMKEKLDRISDNIESTLDLNKVKIELIAEEKNLLLALENNTLDSYLSDRLAEENIYEEYYNLIYFTSLDGTVTHASSENAIGLNVQDREYFALSQTLEETVVSDAIISKSDQNFVVVFMTPVIDDQVIGYLGITLYSNKFIQFIEEIPFGETGYFIIVDSNNKILSHKEKSLFSTPYNYSIKERQYVKDGAYHMTKSLDLEGHQWTAVSVMSEKEVLENSKDLLMYIIILGAIFLLLSIFMSIYLAGLLTKPIGDMTKIIKQVSNGDKKYDEALSLELENFAKSVIGMQTKNIVEVNDLKEALFSMKQYIHSGISQNNLEEEKIYNRYILLVSQRLHVPMVIIGSLIDKFKSHLNEDDLHYIKKLEYEFSKLESELYTTLEDVKSIDFSDISIQKKVSIASIYDSLLKMSQTYVDSNNRIFSVEFDEGIDHDYIYDIDMKMIEHVWQSFLYNAVHYTDISGEIVFKICSNEGNIRFELEDDGRGMPLEYIDALFDNLYEHTKNNLPTFNLFISKKILDANGLHLGIRSLEGHYTRVWFEIPISAKGD